ncbi:MAG: hypothetical protein AMS27_06655 [Bacteroides sp. SM23_62_1]|nr:MAG: hypothetical protein AMS27_06655 [Bacteroides sp. SM23_62_1]
MRKLIILLLFSQMFKYSAAQDIDSIIDVRDSQIYKIVTIGQQFWMQENLNFGVRIAGGINQANNSVIEKYCYNNNESNCNVYGGLYQWDEVMDYSPSDTGNPGVIRGICPFGWHIPTDDEWKELEKYLGMTQAEADLENTWRGTGVGTKLGSGGTSGYNALYSGRVSSSGSFSLLNEYEYVWTSTEYDDYAWRRCLNKYANDVGRWNTFLKSYGFSVRCIIDTSQFSYLSALDRNFRTISKMEFTDEKIADTLVLVNSSAGKIINITSINTTTSSFKVNTSSSVIPPGDSLFLYITLNAVETGIHYTDTLFIESDDPYKSTLIIPLKGYLEPVIADICIITVDTVSGKNLIVWEKDPYAGTAFYNIYREGSIIGQYDLIGTRTYNELSIFTDSTSMPAARTYRYKITAVDTVDHESPKSPYHRPLLLCYNGTYEGVHLHWVEYEVEGKLMDFEAYELYRGFDPNSLTKISEIPADVESYTDTDSIAQKKTCYYRLAGKITTPCCPTINKKFDIVFTHTFSNIEDNKLCAGCDVTPPTVPDGLQATVNGNIITLFWNSSVDDSGVEKYNIYNENHNKIATVYDTTHVFTGLEYDSTYYFLITAVDLSGNESGESSMISATTHEITGINDFIQSQIIIYPNPFNRSTTLRWNNPEGNAYTLYITDLSGKVYRVVEDINTSEYVLKKGELPSGLYLIELRGSEIYRGKIILNSNSH